MPEVLRSIDPGKIFPDPEPDGHFGFVGVHGLVTVLSAAINHIGELHARCAATAKP